MKNSGDDSKTPLAEIDGEVDASPDGQPRAFITVACACHNSRGLSVSRDGAVTEKTERIRCAKHLKEGHPFLDW